MLQDAKWYFFTDLVNDLQSMNLNISLKAQVYDMSFVKHDL